MNSSKLLLMRPLGNIPKVAVGIFLAVAIIGFADAAYLTLEHYRGVIPPCTTDGCETVLTSTYSTVAGIPVALGGAVYYLFMAIAAFMYMESRYAHGSARPLQEKLFKIALCATILGFLGSLYFLYLQAFVIGAYCQYCLVSAATSTILFIMACFICKRSHAQLQNTNYQV